MPTPARPATPTRHPDPALTEHHWQDQKSAL